MTSHDNLQVVLGASGGAGNAIARALHQDGYPVRAVNRSGSADLPEGIDIVASDITTPEGVARAMDGASVVYMASQPAYHRWPQEFPAMLDRVIDGAATVGAKLVMVDNLYGYGPGTGRMTEASPRRATDKKGMVRNQMIDTLLEAHRSGRVRVAIGQASDYFGPRSGNSGITALAIEPVAEGKTIRWTGALDVPHSAAYLPDIGRAFVILGTDDRSDGQVWILPHAPAVTGEQFLDLVNDALPSPLSIGVISATMLRVASPFHRISRESLPIVYQWTEPFVADDTKFQATFGPLAPTPLDEAVKATVEWYGAPAPAHA